MQSGQFVFTAIERMVYGQPAAQALRKEVDRLKAARVFMIVSGTMNRTTDEIAKVREALGFTLACRRTRRAMPYWKLPVKRVLQMQT